MQLLHPFIPFISQQIRESLGFEGPIVMTKIEERSMDITKNYKTQLFMDIIERFLNMKQANGYAKHEEVEICFFAPLDFLQYLRKQETIISSLINTSAIEYLENEKELGAYHTESIINITIGIKKGHKESKVINRKEDIRESLRIKEQKTQQIRSIIS